MVTGRNDSRKLCAPVTTVRGQVMKNWALGLVLAASASTAVAADPADLRTYESNDYSAKVYYRMDFGGKTREAQSVGFRFDNEAATAHGAPSMFQASFGAQGLQKLAISGVDFRSAMLASTYTPWYGGDGGGGFWGSLSGAQWAALGFTAFVFTTVAVDATDDADPDAPGTGTGGN